MSGVLTSPVRKVKGLVKAALIRGFIRYHRYLHRRGILPFSRNFGWERGTPVGRYYIHQFLTANASYVRGRCMDFGDNKNKPLFPGATSYEVLDLTAGPGVDHVCDIHDVSALPLGQFDAIVCMQVLEHVNHPEKACESMFRLLKPGGVLLLTVPFLAPVHYVPTDFRRFTRECIDLILREQGFVVDELDFVGSSLISTGGLLGMVTEDFTPEEMARKDPVYPWIVTARAHKPG